MSAGSRGELLRFLGELTCNISGRVSTLIAVEEPVSNVGRVVYSKITTGVHRFLQI
jgi:hypothetical protein